MCSYEVIIEEGNIQYDLKAGTLDATFIQVMCDLAFSASADMILMKVKLIMIIIISFLFKRLQGC
jgi:hypothetical protein